MHRMTSMSFVTIVRTEADNEYPKTESVLAAMPAIPVMFVMPFQYFIYTVITRAHTIDMIARVVCCSASDVLLLS